MNGIHLSILLAMVLAASVANAQPITYQGQLKQSGQPFTGLVDMNFALYAGLADPTPLAGPINISNVPVEEGLFQVELDFGAGVFDGNDRFLGIVVAGSELSPRQKVTAAPLAVFALTGNEGPPGASPFELIDNDAVYTAGNVGIGTTTPQALLDVAGPTRVGDLTLAFSDQAQQPGGVGEPLLVTEDESGVGFDFQRWLWWNPNSAEPVLQLTSERNINLAVNELTVPRPAEGSILGPRARLNVEGAGNFEQLNADLLDVDGPARVGELTLSFSADADQPGGVIEPLLVTEDEGGFGFNVQRWIWWNPNSAEPVMTLASERTTGFSTNRLILPRPVEGSIFGPSALLSVEGSGVFERVKTDELIFDDPSIQTTAGPVAKGWVGLDGDLVRGANISLSLWNANMQHFELIVIGSDPFDHTRHVVTVQPDSQGLPVPIRVVPAISSANGRLVVRLIDDGGNSVQLPFGLVVHRLPEGIYPVIP